MAHTPFPPRPEAPTPAQIATNLEKCLQHQTVAVTQHAKRPFAALLVAPDHETVLLTHFSISHVEHAEAGLARLAALHYAPEYLWRCTLYSTWEPCAMCAGTAYWANIGRVVYAAGEDDLKASTGAGNAENFTMSLPCREVFAKGQKEIEVWGPVEGMAERVIEASEAYWKPVREGAARVL